MISLFLIYNFFPSFFFFSSIHFTFQIYLSLSLFFFFFKSFFLLVFSPSHMYPSLLLCIYIFVSPPHMYRTLLTSSICLHFSSYFLSASSHFTHKHSWPHSYDFPFVSTFLFLFSFLFVYCTHTQLVKRVGLCLTLFFDLRERERENSSFNQPGDYFMRKKMFGIATVIATVFSSSRELLQQL